MSTLDNRRNTALVIVDLQVGVVENAWRRDAVVANAAAAVEAARSAGIGVIWVRHADDELVADSDAWQIVPELVPVAGEPIVEKSYRDAFDGTRLETVLAERGVGRLVVAGAQSDFCIRSTLHGAFARGYDTVLLADAHTTDDLRAWGAPAPDAVVAHTNMLWSGQTAPGRRAGIVATAELDFVRIGAQAPGGTPARN